jgi:hypothetical protein
MKKTYLILVNAAFKMGDFHLDLGDDLEKRGEKVIYAFVDKLPFYTEDLDLNGKKYYIFSEYFKENYCDSEAFDLKYNGLNVNKLYYPDYDRDVIYSGMKTFSHTHYKKLMVNLINFFDHIIKENKIDLCIYESISNSFSYTAYEVLKINNIPYCGYAGCRLKERFELYTEEFGSLNTFKENFQNMDISQESENKIAYAYDYLQKYLNESETPTYHPKNTHLDWNHSLIKKYFNWGKIKLITGSILYSFKENSYIKYSYQIGNPANELFRSFIKQIKKQYRIRVADKYFDRFEANDRFYLYPQHFKPEASTSVLARHYCDDIAVIRNIAFNLPFGTFLYVKEHFVNFGRLSLSYYKELKKIPNVKLISYNENTSELIKRSLGVITLTSTVGFEALMLNKPVFAFGNVFYQCHPNCRKLHSFESLHDKLTDLSVNTDESINMKFILAYYNTSYSGNVYYNIDSASFSKDEFFTRFVNAISERIV